jgi:hypothetical protein
MSVMTFSSTKKSSRQAKEASLLTYSLLLRDLTSQISPRVPVGTTAALLNVTCIFLFFQVSGFQCFSLQENLNKS